MGEQPGSQRAGAGRTAQSVPYAAVGALRADMRQLRDEVRTLIQEADRCVTEAGLRPRIDDDEW